MSSVAHAQGSPAGAAAEAGGVAAKFRLGAEFVGAFPVGPTASVGTPALGGRVQAHYFIGQTGISIGALGGRQSTTFRLLGGGEANLSDTSFGGSVRYESLRWPWHTRPFVGLDVGYTTMTLDQATSIHAATFDPPYNDTSSTGMFIAPRLGVRGMFASNIGIEASFQYSHIVMQRVLAVGGRRLKNLTGMGLAFGLFVAF